MSDADVFAPFSNYTFMNGSPCLDSSFISSPNAIRLNILGTFLKKIKPLLVIGWVGSTCTSAFKGRRPHSLNSVRMSEEEALSPSFTDSVPCWVPSSDDGIDMLLWLKEKPRAAVSSENAKITSSSLSESSFFPALNS